MQEALIALFDPQLADVFGAPVIARLVLFLDALFFAGVDAANVANQVAGQVAIRVLAKQSGLHLHPRKAVALGHKARHLGIAQARADGQGVEIA